MCKKSDFEQTQQLLNILHSLTKLIFARIIDAREVPNKRNCIFPMNKFYAIFDLTELGFRIEWLIVLLTQQLLKPYYYKGHMKTA